jgi:hypothetical protein
MSRTPSADDGAHGSFQHSGGRRNPHANDVLALARVTSAALSAVPLPELGAHFDEQERLVHE